MLLLNEVCSEMRAMENRT